MKPTAMNVQLHNNDHPAATGNSAPALRFFGHLFSFLLHPLFIPAYLAAFLIFKHPYAYAGLNLQQKEYWFAAILFSTVFLPAFSIFLMKKLGFIESVYLRTQRDRIIPYIVSMIFYFWIWYVSHNLHHSPEMVAMLLATFIASIAGMMANIYFKISMHGIAAGMLLVFFIWLALGDAVYLGNYLVAAVFVTGLICTARFIVSDHSPFELYTGLLAGALCQLVAIAIAG